MVDRTTTIGLLAVVATVIATVSVATQTRELAITHVSVIDVVEGRILPNSTVTISGKTISSRCLLLLRSYIDFSRCA